VTRRAVVLGGGGPVGIAWETGLAAGLERAGVRLRNSDLFVGTSAGSVVGAQLALGKAPDKLIAMYNTIDDAEHPSQKPLDFAAIAEKFTAMFISSDPPEKLRADMGGFALKAETISEEEWLDTFRRMPGMAAGAWPDHRFICTAVDAANGAFVTWDNDAGVPLDRAVASSCAVPGIYPPVTINGRRYIDGGVRSPTNADLARGCDAVLIISVTAPGISALPAVAEAMQRQLDGEIAALRQAGSLVETIVPDEASLQSFGLNLMDFARREPVVEAGARQGFIEAARLREFWIGASEVSAR
jgi:NTE family protein